ncbi:MAG TPA: cation diffusion facilitator family transporter [Bryobacteraceae bacterium]|nr:cation diffusion facilitator family transporter [Bryobacteraceae bacterium]
MGHGHVHAPATGSVLRISIFVTLLLVGTEVFFGFRANSLALISDAGHNFTDAVALLLAAIGFYLQSKPADAIKTYGYHRAGVLAAFVNSITLLLISAYIFYEAWQRLTEPRPVGESTLMGVAALSLVVNSAIMWGLHRDRASDLNIRAAWVHMLGDALSSVALIGGGALIYFTGWTRIDPLLSIFIGALILWSAWDITRESLNILLEGLPRGMRLDDVIAAMRRVDGVIDVHDLHIWSLGSSTHALSCHVMIEDVPPSESRTILARLNEVLCGFHIHHTTVQFEHQACALSESGCAMQAGAHAHHHQH